MKKKLAALLMSAALIVPAGAIMLTGCGGNKGGGSEEHHEQEIRINELIYNVGASTKFDLVHWPHTDGISTSFKAYVEVRKGVDLQESDFHVSATAYTETGSSYDINAFTVDSTNMQYGEMTWVPDEDLYTVWTTYGDIKYNHVIRYTYDAYTLELYIRVLPEVIDLTSTKFTDVDYTTFSFEDVLTSTTQDEGGKYIDIIDKLDAAQANDELKLSYLESQGLITIGRGIQGQTDPETGILIDDTIDVDTQTYHDVTRAYHANSSGNGINYKYTITAAPGYSIRFTENDYEFEDVSREFYWHIDSIDIDANDYQLSNTNLVFNPSQTQHPTVTFNSDTTLPEDLFEYENCAYWAGSYNSIGVCIRGTYQRDYGFVSGDEAYYLVNIEQAEDWWTIAPLELDHTQVKFAGNPPTTSYTTTYTGSAIEPQLSYSALTAIVDIFEAAYVNNVDVTTQAQAKLVIKDYYTLVVDGEPHDCNIWNTYYIGRGYGNITNSIVWDNAEQGVTHYEDLVLPFTITKADYTFQTQNLQVHMTYDEDMTQETFATLVGNLGYYYGSQTLEWDLDVQNELSSNGEFGYDGGRCVYVLKPGQDISMDVGTRTFVAQYYHDINNYNVTEITITLTVNKIQVYPILYWNYSWQGYTYTGSAQTVPYLTQSQEEHEFGITYQTFAAVEESENTWVPTGNALESVVNAGRYITIATITSEAHYEPVGVSEGDLQYVWYVDKVQAYAPLYSLTHDNGYDSVLSGNYYGEYQKPTSSGYTTVKNLFTYYTGSAKTITLNNYYATGAGHADYWTEVTLTHQYSADGTTNWTSKTAEQLSAVGYYRTTLTFVCDDNHVFDNETSTASDTLEWRIITNTIAVDSINFNSVANVYEAREVGNILPTLPANAVPEYLDLTYTRYYWSTNNNDWRSLGNLGGRDNTAGTYKVVATVKAIPGYDGADGVTYTKNSQAQAGTEYTAELEYTVNLVEGTLPAELESGDLILAYHYAVNDTIDTWDNFARNINVGSSDLGRIDFDDTVIIANNKTSNNIIYNLDVLEEDRIWQYSGAITIVDAYRDDANKKADLVNAIANHITTDVVQDGYWTLVMSYTRNSGVYTAKEFTVRFYIAPMPDETPDYLIDSQDSDKLTLKLTYEYVPNNKTINMDNLEYMFGNISTLVYTDSSHELHFDNGDVIHDGDTSLEIAQHIDTTWGHYTYFNLVDHNGSKQVLLDAINAKQTTTLTTYVNYTLDNRIWEAKEYKIDIIIAMKPTLNVFEIMLSVPAGDDETLKTNVNDVMVWDMDFDDESTIVLVPTGEHNLYVVANSIYADKVDITYENSAKHVHTDGEEGATGESVIIITAKEGYEFANGVTQMVINLKWKATANYNA